MKKIIIFVFLGSLLLSCKKTQGPEGPQGPQGSGNIAPKYTGTIKGNVLQFSEIIQTPVYTNIQYTTALNTVTVSIDGTTLTTVTDLAGNYTLSNVPSGLYELSFTKSGAGLSKKQQVVLIGTETLYVSSDSVYDKCSNSFISGLLKDTIIITNSTSDHNLGLRLHYTPSVQLRNFVMIFGKTSTVDLSNPESYDQVSFGSYGGTSGNMYSYFPYSYIFNANYKSGAIVYAKVYPISSKNYNYFDFQKRKGVYTTYGTPLNGTFTITLP